MKKFQLILLTLTMVITALMGCAVPPQQPAATLEPTADVEQPASSPVASAPVSPADETPQGAAASVTANPINEYVQLYIKQKTVTTETETVTLIIINSGEETYSYDYVQRLERKNADGTWETVPLTNDAVSLALLVISGGETQEQVFDFANHYEPLERGAYRIVKTFVKVDGGLSDAYCEFDMM